MKIFAIVMAMLAVMLLTADASAQGCSATLYNDSYVLDNLCGAGGTPFADGTVTIEIVWDSDSDGPDWDDPLAPLCDDPPNCEPPNNSNTANINSFPINGTNEGYGDGYFYQWDPAFTSNNTLFSPNIFYLRICVSNPAMYYVSETFSPLAGPSEINLDSWTCFSTGCVGQCPPPPTPTGFVASDNQCGMVHMTWNPYTADSSATEYVDSLIILRGGTRIGKVPRWATQFDDLTGTVNTTYVYGIQARRRCLPSDTALSSQATDEGIARPAPQIPQSVLATENQCGQVGISWTYSSNLGLDSFYVKRGATIVGRLDALTTPGAMSFTHVTSDTTLASYCVVGKSNTCGEGTPACDNGRALGVPGATCVATGVSATDGNCNAVTVTWTDAAPACGVTGYHVIRYNNDGSGRNQLTTTPILPNVHTYQTSFGTTNTIYRYTVQSLNTCGLGSESAFDTGFWIGPPPQVTISSVDSLCTYTRINWTDVAGETFYRILRASVVIDTIPANSVTYNDSTAVPGTVYLYQVQAMNTCGLGTASIGVNGRRRNVPAQVTGVSASDSTECWGVHIAWTFVTADSFIVKRNGLRIGQVLSDVTAYDDAAAVEGIVYTYTVTAHNMCGAGTESSGDSGSRRARPAQVAGLTVSNDLCDAVLVAWDDVARETGYIIRRNGSFLTFVNEDTTRYYDHPPLGMHNYTVQAINECGASPVSSPATGYLQVTPTITLLNLDVLCQQVVLHWSATAQADIVQIYRDGMLLDSALASAASYTDIGLAMGNYAYHVIALNECGFSMPSDTLTAIIADLPQTPLTFSFTDNHCDSLTLHWQNGGGSFGVYRIYKDDSLAAMVVSINSSWTDTAIIIGETHSYKVSAYSDTCGESDISDAIVGGISSADSLASPQVVITLVGQDAVLHWNAISETVDGCRALVAGYLVFYSANASGPYFYHGFTTDTSYVHIRVLQFALGMNYQVFAYAGELGLLRELVPGMEITVAKGMLKKD